MNTDKTPLENESQPSCLGDVISSFNTKSKRMVKVISGDDFITNFFNIVNKK